jgi:hypothetical protein
MGISDSSDKFGVKRRIISLSEVLAEAKNPKPKPNNPHPKPQTLQFYVGHMNYNNYYDEFVEK